MQTQRSLLIVGLLIWGGFTTAQEPPAPTPQESAPVPTVQRGESGSNGKKRNLPAYVILGTVFNEKALSYPNARVQIRREAEKKFRWETYTNSRGEFSMRVPEGQEYEVVVREKKYKDVSVKVTANAGELQQRLSIRLEPAIPEKGGEKK